MLSLDSLKILLHSEEIKNPDKLLLCLAFKPDTPKSNKEIIEIYSNLGWMFSSTNVSTYLKRSKYAIKIPEGWELLPQGRERVRGLAGKHVDNYSVMKVASSLRDELAKISDPQIKSFVEEAIVCFEHALYRSAVVLSWVGALSVLYEYILRNKLSEFNAEALRRNRRWSQAAVFNDLAKMKEYEFLQILASISVIGQSQKQRLEGALQFRNGCGHPNHLELGENMVAAHIELLIKNIFSKFDIS